MPRLGVLHAGVARERSHCGCATGSGGKYPSPFLILYFFVAAEIYSAENGWSYSASLYYAAQAGWSVGFGALVEKSDSSRWFTVFFVLAGASMVGGAVAVLIAMVLERQSDWHHQEEVNARSVDNATDDDSTAFCSVASWRHYANEARTAAAFLLWVAAGVAFGVHQEKWSVGKSVYFSVTSLSTGGLLAARIDPHSDTFTNYFMAFWIMTGVPVFALGVGQLAGLLVESYMRQKLKEKVLAQICEEDFQYAACLNSAASRLSEAGESGVDFGEFLQFTLIRAGVLDPSMLHRIRDRFQYLDEDGSGTISMDEMKAALEFDRFDVDRSGGICVGEFMVICQRLHIGTSPQERVQIFQKLDIDANDSISRREFTQFYRQHLKQERKRRLSRAPTARNQARYQDTQASGDIKSSEPDGQPLSV